MKKIFMFLAVAGLLTFSANYQASAQDEQATEQVAAASDEADPFAAGSTEQQPLHQALKTTFIEGGAGFMATILLCLILGLADRKSTRLNSSHL